MTEPSPPWHFLVNPAAGNDKAIKRWQAMSSTLRRELPGMSIAISSPGLSLEELTHHAVKQGKRHLVGVGGDGTHHDILNALVATGSLSSVLYVPLSLGSGNDWVRSLGVPSAPLPFARYLRTSPPKEDYRQHLVGRIEFMDTGVVHHFLNVAGFAYDAEVVRMAEERRVRSRLMYPLLAAAYLRKYRAPEVGVRFGSQVFRGPIHTLNVGIGRYSGGGMSFVPHADPFGQKLALTIVPRMPVWKVIANSWRLYNGSITSLQSVTSASVDSVSLQPISGELECEADGEWLGRGRVSLSILPEPLLTL